jgi:transmembrane E3 ubiquitin-protein ligase
MSLITLSICNIEDFYLTMVHIEYIMTTGTAYLFFILPAVSYLMLFVIFDMKMLFLVWRSQHMRDIENAQALRKKLTAFYIQFYLGLFAYLTLNYFFQFDAWLIFVQHLLIVPQIVHNVRKGNNPGFSWLYIFGFLGLRFLIPLYERGCP